ncbi:MAG: hypothetical protein FWF24_07510 [Alphaproteobacteria bacterium]|nr:hypothetical protein [Alphaproteobacteria bacterium]
MSKVTHGPSTQIIYITTHNKTQDRRLTQIAKTPDATPAPSTRFLHKLRTAQHTLG